MNSFLVRDILSVTTGRLLGQMGGIYDVMGAMFGDGISTIGIAMFASNGREELYRQYPVLRDVDTAKLSRVINEAKSGGQAAVDSAINDFVAEVIQSLGGRQSLPVGPSGTTHGGAEGDINAIRKLRPDAQVIVVAAGG